MVLPPRMGDRDEAGRAEYADQLQRHAVFDSWRVQPGVVLELRPRRLTYRCSHWCRAAAREPAARRDDRVPSRLMSGTTAELPNDWWTTEDVLAFLRSAGAPISRATWAAYVSRGQAPAP